MLWGPLLILICQPTLNSMLMGLCPGIYYSMKAVCGRSPQPPGLINPIIHTPSMEDTILTCHGGVEGLITVDCTLRISSIL